MGTFIIRRILQLILVMFVITRARVPDLLPHARASIRPARSPAATRPPQTVEADQHQFGLDRPLPVQYVLMMKQMFITRDLVSYSNQGQKVVPEVVAGHAGDALARVRRGRHLGGGVDRDGAGGRGVQGHRDRPVPDDPRADRDLDARVLGGRAGEPDHAEPLARHVPVPLGAAARLHAVHPGPGPVVQGSRDPLDHAVDRSTSASTRACCARACSRSRTRTSCARRGPRASPSGACSCATRCAPR